MTMHCYLFQGILRVKSQNKFVIGNHTLPFIPATYEEVSSSFCVRCQIYYNKGLR